MVNKVILIGNLGKDPEMTYTPSGVAVTKVSLATTERWTSKDGQKQEQTEWHNLVFWRRQAEVANQYLRKGSRIYVEGRLKYRQWEGQDGQTRYATDIEVQNFQFLSPRGEGSGGGESNSGRAASKSSGQPQGGGQKTEPGDTHYEPFNPNEGSDSFGSGDDSDLPF
jgi:single-strand DNA-binding protein